MILLALALAIIIPLWLLIAFDDDDWFKYG